MDTADRIIIAGIGICAGVFVFSCGGAVGQKIERDRMENLAVQKHLARWTIDPVTGEREFVYGCEVCRQQQMEQSK